MIDLDNLAQRPLSRRSMLTAMGGVAVAALTPAAVAARSPVRRRVIVIGGGIAGLTAAYEIEKLGSEAILLEARDRFGGRAWTIRGGDRVNHLGEDDQRAAFSDGLYLNAGAARVPSHHDRYLGLARELHVPLEALVNSSRSAFVGSNRAPGGDAIRIRQAANDLRGHLSALLEKALRSGALDQELNPQVRGKLAEFLKVYGDLAADGSYRGSERSGLSRLPGATIEQAVAVPPVTLDALLANPELSMLLFEEHILMQPTMLQLVGGMDQLPVAIAKALRSKPRLNADVREIRRSGAGVRIVYRDQRSGRDEIVEGDRAIITAPLPILGRTANDFSPAVRQAIASVRYDEAMKIGFESPPFWEADQIYGGISFVGGDTSLIWYPSGPFLAKREVLLAAYCVGEQAQRLGAHDRARQIEIARDVVERLHPGHGRDLAAPALIQWSKVPYSEGPWIDWTNPKNDLKAATTLNAGDGPFLFAGSHLSAYSGHWQEGAILSASRAAVMATTDAL